MIKLIKTTFHNETKTKSELNRFILKAKTLSMNSECKKYEKAFAKKQQRKYAVFVNSGSSANLALLQALLNLDLIRKNDRVGFSAVTWATNVMPIIQLGMEPVAIDCNLETLNIPPEKIEKNVGKIKALFLTNVLGLSDHIEKIKLICENNNIILIEDNCESLGSRTSKKLLGNFGLASTFSFFVGHHLSTIEGGMICTDSKRLYNMLVMIRAHDLQLCHASAVQK